MKQAHYETTFIFAADAVKKTDEIINHYVSLLQAEGAQIVYQYPSVEVKLAYPIQKKASAISQCIEFVGHTLLISKMEKEYNRDERILRFLSVRMDKHAIKFREKERQKQQDEATSNQKG